MINSRLNPSWQRILASSLLGALLMAAFHAVSPAKYQASAVLGVSVNYGITTLLDLGGDDRVLSQISEQILSEEALFRMVEALPAEIETSQNISDPADLRKTLRLDRNLAQWHLIAIDRDPEMAAALANAWARSSMEVIDEAVEHAWRAIALDGAAVDLNCSPTENAAHKLTLRVWECSASAFEGDDQELASEILTEANQSNGMPPVISYELLQVATVPAEANATSRGPWMLLGALGGSMAAIGYAWYRHRSGG